MTLKCWTLHPWRKCLNEFLWESETKNHSTPFMFASSVALLIRTWHYCVIIFINFPILIYYLLLSLHSFTLRIIRCDIAMKKWFNEASIWGAPRSLSTPKRIHHFSKILLLSFSPRPSHGEAVAENWKLESLWFSAVAPVDWLIQGVTVL